MNSMWMSFLLMTLLVVATFAHDHEKKEKTGVADGEHGKKYEKHGGNRDKHERRHSKKHHTTTAAPTTTPVSILV